MRRLPIFHGFVITGFIFLCLTLIHYQVIQFNKYRQLDQANRIRVLPQSASRGNILDTNGEVLAGSTVSYDLLLMSTQATYPEEQVSKFSSLLLIPQEKLKSILNNKHNALFAPILLSKDICLSEAIAIGQFKYDFPELIIQPNSKRVYQLGESTSHILGYLNQIDIWRLEQLKEYGYKIRDLVGYSGIEEAYDYLLRPQEGGMQVEVDSRGRLSRVLGFKAPQKGRDIELTIDSRLQKIVYNNLQGKTGCVLMLDPNDGDILALASFPSFDPQIFQDGPAYLVNSLLKDPDAPLLNRAISGLYPPGSVFKIIVASAGLERNIIDTNSSFLCPGKMQIGNRQFSCWDTHGQQQIIDAIAHSCNVFFYNLGLRVGPQSIIEYARRYGLNRPTRIDLSAESRGFLPYSLWQRIRRQRSWFAGDTANLSIGQGELLVTPIEVSRMMAAIANGGKLIRPHLLKSTKQTSQYIDASSKKAVNLPIKKETLDIIRKGLVGAVKKSEGTANILDNIGISIAGKTGSAQVQAGRAHGWFVGYFPVDKPRYVICVLLEHVGSGYYSCQVAGKIIEQMLKDGLI